MSSVGARIVKQKPTPADCAAGVKKIAKQGEGNVQEIWPAYQVNMVDKQTRALATHDINQNNANPRARKLNEKDRQFMEMANRKRIEASPGRPSYKNCSTIFNHHTDDPTFRSRANKMGNINNLNHHMQGGSLDAPDVLDRELYQGRDSPSGMNYGDPSHNQLPPVDLMNGHAPDMQAAAMMGGVDNRTGKKIQQKSQVSVAQGKNRLFGGGGEDTSGVEEVKRGGKRVIQRVVDVNGLSLIQ